MTIESPVVPLQNARSHRAIVVAVLAILAIIVVLLRLRTYDEPLENDVAGYAVIAREMLHGRALYSDLWERKPPLLYGIFAAAELAVGPGRPAVFAVNIAAGLASLLAIFAAARAASGTAAGLFAAGLWTLLGGDLFLQANQPNAEALANPFLTAAVAMLLVELESAARAKPGANGIWLDDPSRWWVARAATVGLLLAAATLIKHHLVVSAGAMLAGYVFTGTPSLRIRRLRDVAVAIATIAVCWIGTTAYFAATGRLHVFIEILAGQNIGYAGNPLVNLVVSLSWSAMTTVSIAWLVAPVLLLIGAFAFGDAAWRKKSSTIMWVAWAIAAWVAEALPGKLFPHYFQYWIPFWCVTGGVAAAALIESTREIPVFLRCGVITIAFAFAAFRQLQVLQLSPDDWADVKYPGGNYTQQKYLGRALAKKILLHGETFWVGGDDVSLYLESGLSPPTGLLYVDPMTDGPAKELYNRRLVADLSAHPPDLILLTPLIERFPADAPIFGWMREHYQPWDTSIGGRIYHLSVRRGSALARRVGI